MKDRRGGSAARRSHSLTDAIPASAKQTHFLIPGFTKSVVNSVLNVCWRLVPASRVMGVSRVHEEKHRNQKVCLFRRHRYHREVALAARLRVVHSLARSLPVSSVQQRIL